MVGASLDAYHYSYPPVLLLLTPLALMAHVPAELFAARYAVSYVPSGSVLARLAENHRAVDGSSLLTVGSSRSGAPPSTARRGTSD